MNTHPQQKILDAALLVFSLSGYNGATVRDIATRAGVNQTALFKHFSDKKNMFLQTCHYAADLAEQRLAISLPAVDRALIFII